jgi:hypothetical protein
VYGGHASCSLPIGFLTPSFWLGNSESVGQVYDVDSQASLISNGLTSPVQTARERALDVLLSGPGVLVFWATWCVAHVLARLSESSALVPDEARSSVFAQYFASGYSLQLPPIYAWVLWLTQELIGSNFFSNVALRYAVAASIGLAAYAAARVATDDRRLAAIASLSLIFIPHVGWTVHTMLTDTLILSIACFLSFTSLVAFIRRPSLGAAAVLGLSLASGMLAKWNFILFVVGLGVAAASLREARSSLRDPRLLVAVALALLCYFPYLHWVVSQLHTMLIVAQNTTTFSTGGHSYPIAVAIGFARLPLAIGQFLLPFLALAGAAAWTQRHALGVMPPGTLGERLAWRTLAATVAVAFVGIALTGATGVIDRYMHPVVILAPVAFFSTLARTLPSQRLMRSVASVSVLLAATIFVLVVVSPLATGMPFWRFYQFWPYDRLATELEARGLAGATFVVPDIISAGNIRAFVPQARVIAIDYQVDRSFRPPASTLNLMRCVAIWWQSSSSPDGSPLRWQPSPLALPSQWSSVIAGRQAEFIRVAWRQPPIGQQRFAAWNLVELDPALAICK